MQVQKIDYSFTQTKGYRPLGSPVYRTKDYEGFIFLKEINRNVKGFADLVDSIKQHNLMDVLPCVVNEKNEVYDGQHRIEAAKELNEWVYYVIRPGLTPQDLPLFQVQRPWQQEDWLKYRKLIGENTETYVFFDSLCQNFNLPMNTILYLLTDKFKPFKAFRKGTVKMDKTKQEAYDIVQNVEELQSVVKEISPRKQVKKNAHIAMSMIIRLKGYQHEECKRRMKMNKDATVEAFEFERPKIIMDYFLERVYNFRNPKKIGR